jgi:hypothetical protein
LLVARRSLWRRLSLSSTALSISPTGLSAHGDTASQCREALRFRLVQLALPGVDIPNSRLQRLRAGRHKRAVQRARSEVWSWIFRA